PLRAPPHRARTSPGSLRSRPSPNPLFAKVLPNTSSVGWISRTTGLHFRHSTRCMMRHAWDLPAPRARALGRGHPGSDHRAAPVDAQVLAGDHGGVLAREVGDQRGDLLRRDEAAGGDLLPRRLALLPDPD